MINMSLGDSVTSSLSARRSDGQIRVCVRGIFGLLGSRIALAIARNPDLRLTVGIAKNDTTLRDALKAMKALPENIRRSCVAEKMYLDEPHRTVREVNASQDLV